MSDAKAKIADIVAGVRARAVEYARRLPPVQRDRLTAWAGKSELVANSDPAEICVAVASTGGGTRRILAAIERDAREALFLFLCGSDVLDDGQFETHLRNFFGWSKARSRGAIDALALAGLLSRNASPSHTVEAFPALRLGLGPDLLDWLAGAAVDAPPTMPLARRLALLVAHAHADPVTLTAQRALTVRWMDRAHDVFAAGELSSQLLTAGISFLGRSAALGPEPSDAEAKTWRVEARAPEALASAPADLALALADAAELSTWGATMGTLALLERARLAGDESPTIHRLAELGRAWLDEPHTHYVPFYESHFRPLAIASAVRALRSIGLVAVETSPAGVRVRRTTPVAPPPKPFRCTVLPTFEIWVAEDADPAGTAELGRIADLASTDRVARFTLTQKSVARAAREPGGAAAAIERLAAAAEHGLPDNVRTTLEGWTRRATSMRAYRGGVIVATSDDHATFLRGRSGVLSEIAPGVFHVDSESLTELLRAAEKAGYVTAPVVRDGRPGGHHATYVDPRPLGVRAEDVRAKLALWAKPTPPKPAARPAPRETPTPPPIYVDVDELRRGRPLTLRELRNDWPDVAAAVRGYPPIQALALRLTLGQLDELLDLDDPVKIRSQIAKFAFDAMDFPSDAGAAAAPSRTPAATPSPTPSPVAKPIATPDATPASATGGQPWFTPKPGELYALLATAARLAESLDIVYVNAAGVRTERRILPLELVHSGHREWLDAKLEVDHSTNRFELDRIVAVRLVGP